MKIIDRFLEKRGYVKKAAKAEVPIFDAASFISSGLTGEGVTYKTLCDCYKSWVFTCIDKISKTVASLPLELYFYKQNGSKVNSGMQIKSIVNSTKDRRERNYYIKENNIEKIRVFEHPVIDLFNNPNQIDTRMTLWINIMIRIELAGYCGLYMPKNVLGLPAQLWAFPLTENATLSINTDPKTIIKNFSYRDNSVNMTIERDEMLYMRYPHPGSPIYGQSPLLTQEYPYDIDKFLMQYMYYMLKNKSTFGNVFTTDHELMKDQITDLQSLMATQYEGATRSGKPIFTHSGLHLDNTKLGSTFKDLMINEAAQYASDRLITSYGMTPANVGFVKDINRSTSEVLDKNYYDQCIRPRCMLIEEFFEKELLPRYDEGLMLDFKIPNITDRALDLQERRENLGSGYSTINEERAKEEGREPAEWGDEPWMPFSLSQPSKPKAPVINTNQEEPDEINEENESNDDNGSQENSKAYRKAIVWTAERKRKASELFVKAVEARKNLILKIIIDHFNQQEAEVISRLESGGKAIVSNLSGFYKDKRRVWIKNNKAKLEDVNINVEEEAQLLEKKMKPIITSIIMDVAEDRLDEFDVKFEFNVADKTVSQWLGRRLRDTAHDIEETTHDKINAVLREGFQEGLSVTTMAEQLKAEFNTFSQSRALMIARTETVSASNFADIEAVKQAGLDDRLRKFWLNEVDARDTHIAAGKQYDENNPIPLNQDFVVGQDTMTAPGNGSLPEENINCRCGIGYTEA